MSRRGRFAAPALVLGLLAGLALAEGALRAADRLGWIDYWEERREARARSIWVASADPALGYEHRPDYAKDGVRYTERHGILRAEDVAPAPAAGVRRVAVVGDSVSAGIELAYAERFPARIEAALAAEGRPTEVLNFGVNGYATSQEIALLEGRVARFGPELVLLQYCVNDFHPSEYPAGWFRPIPRSYVLAFLRHQLERRREVGYAWAGHWERLYREDAEGWRGVEQGFARAAAWSRRQGVPVWLLAVPALQHEGWEAGDAAGRQARIVDAAHRAGLAALDLLPVLGAHPVEALRLHPWDTFHLNAAGHALVAEAILAHRGADGWLGLPGEVLLDQP